MTENCKHCGGPMPPREKTRGRPPVYCSPECKRTGDKASTKAARLSREAREAAENGARVRNMRWR